MPLTKEQSEAFQKLNELSVFLGEDECKPSHTLTEDDVLCALEELKDKGLVRYGDIIKRVEQNFQAHVPLCGTLGLFEALVKEGKIHRTMIPTEREGTTVDRPWYRLRYNDDQAA